MAERKSLTVYKQPRGAGFKQVVGVKLLLVSGSDPAANSARWRIQVDSLGGLIPRQGDRFRDENGQWWAVKDVATDSGFWVCDCDKRQQG